MQDAAQATTEPRDDSPLLAATRPGWAVIALADLDSFLADHAVCEQQAALSALNLVAHYPEDDELVRRMTALAAEEVQHLARVVRLLHRRGLKPARRRTNPYVQALRTAIRGDREPELKVDRLLVGALIEARSSERFTLLGQTVGDHDPEVAALLSDLGPAERRHWRMFHDLAARELPPEALETRWNAWRNLDAEWAANTGHAPTVHG